MKNKLLIVLLIGVFTLILTGCNNKKEEKKVEVKGPRVVCTTTETKSGIKTEVKATMKFNKDNYMTYQVLETILTFDTEIAYNNYKNVFKTNKDEKTADGFEYIYKSDDSKRTLTSTIIYNESLFDYSNLKEEEKKGYTLSSRIKDFEDNGAKCKYIGFKETDAVIKK